MSKDTIYFIAIIPPEPFRQEAWDLKEYMRDKYRSKASLNSPPHITLYPPFKLQKEEKALIKDLEETAAKIDPFRVELKDYGAFPPRVIFIDVEEQPLLHKLQETISKRVDDYAKEEGGKKEERPYHPHMTLAFRDLEKAYFKEAWKEFKERELSYSWQVKEFTLLKHSGKKWDEYRQFSLKD